MSKPTATIYLVSVKFHNITWDETNGGPQGINIEYGGQNIPFRSGNNLFPVFNPIVDREFAVTFELSEYVEEIRCGRKDDMIIVIQKPDDTKTSITYPNMVFVGSTASQPRGQYATRTMRFVYEAAVGSTDPVLGSLDSGS